MRKAKSAITSVTAIAITFTLLFNLCGCSLFRKPPVDTVEATFDDPAGLDEWFMVSEAAYNRMKGFSEYPCYCKVNGIIIGNAASRSIEEFDALFDPDIEYYWNDRGLTDEYQYMLVNGEVLYPSDFPVKPNSKYGDIIGIGFVSFSFSDHENNLLEDEVVFVMDMTNFVVDGMPQKGEPYKFTTLYAIKKDCPPFYMTALCLATYKDRNTVIFRYVDPL